ncbi:phosphatidylserine decarboxylase family protein [Desulfovibrio sp. DS-1]|jgi:phosphatidylserine decarboxylase|nr:phosphatidylserine decarboxylase family protein [Desulfovibrio sp. DS-1]
MRKTSVGLAIEGLPFIFLSSFSALIFSLIGCWPLAVVMLAVTWISAHFFRDPERVVPTAKGIAVSPADGKIVKIQETPDPFTGQPRICVSVFMNLLSVHVNRMPVAAKINAISYYPGKFFNASLDKASQYNERCAYSIESEDGNFVMVQIAGLVAQRIVPRVEEGDELGRGERFGMIKFGSRVDLYLPENYTPAVSIGQKVFAGQTVIAARQEDKK